jgi:hypothetical protein
MAIEPFAKLTLAEQIRRERLVRTERRRLRLELLAQRNLIAARLEERRLAQLASDSRFQALHEKVQGLAAFAHLQDRATYLARAIDALSRRKAIEQGLPSARQKVSGVEDR